MTRLAALKAAPELSFVACTIGETTFVIPIARVREIAQPLKVTIIPDAPPALLGAVDHRGEVVPVVDPGIAMTGKPTAGLKRKWVMVRIGDRTVGVVVGQVFEVFRARESDIRRAPEMGGVAAYTTLDVVPYDGNMAFVIDLEAVARLAQNATESRGAVSDGER